MGYWFHAIMKLSENLPCWMLEDAAYKEMKGFQEIHARRAAKSAAAVVPTGDKKDGDAKVD